MAYTVKRLDTFSDWLKGLKDELTRQRLNKRLRKAQLGNLGDIEPVGDGVALAGTQREGIVQGCGGLDAHEPLPVAVADVLDRPSLG